MKDDKIIKRGKVTIDKNGVCTVSKTEEECEVCESVFICHKHNGTVEDHKKTGE